jgi:hypothetical protein
MSERERIEKLLSLGPLPGGALMDVLMAWGLTQREAAHQVHVGIDFGWLRLGERLWIGLPPSPLDETHDDT